MTEDKENMLGEVPHGEWLPAEREPVEPPLMQWKLRDYDLSLALGECLTRDGRSDGRLITTETEGTSHVEEYQVDNYVIHVEVGRADANPHAGKYRMKILTPYREECRCTECEKQLQEA